MDGLNKTIEMTMTELVNLRIGQQNIHDINKESK